jgi:hypothetical protein
VTEDKATRYHRRRRRADFAGTVLVGLFLLLLSATGAAGLIRWALEWTTGWLPAPFGPLLAAGLFFAGLVATVNALELPFAWYQGYWLERRYGLTTQILAHWLADHVKAVTASGVVMWSGLVAGRRRGLHRGDGAAGAPRAGAAAADLLSRAPAAPA